MTCERGKCLICGTMISEPCPECGNAWKNLDNYTVVRLLWSNGSKMDTAVCIPCAQNGVAKADKQEMTQAIWDAWDRTGGTYDKAVTIMGLA